MAEQIRKTIGRSMSVPVSPTAGKTYRTAWRRSLASHCAGIGLRALSLVDLAAWDLAARMADRSIAEFLGGVGAPMPATAIIGYPPANIGPKETGRQVAELSAAGWRRFKAPVGATPELSAARLRAARAAAPEGWLGCDAAWIFDEVAPAADFAGSIGDVRLGWLEDIFPPGNAQQLAELRKRRHADRHGRRAGWGRIIRRR